MAIFVMCGKKIEKYVNIEEIVFDATIFLAFFIFSRFTGSYELFLLKHPFFFIFILVLMEIFAPLYLGFIYSRFKSVEKSGLYYLFMSKVVLITAFILSIVICIYLPFASAVQSEDIVIGLFTIINIIIGPFLIITGWEQGTRMDRKIEQKASEIFTVFIHVVNYAFIFPVVLILFFALVTFEFKMLIFFIAFYGLYLAISSVLKRTDTIDKIFYSDIVKVFILPGLMCVLFSIAMDLLVNILVQNFSNHLFLALIFSGLLPVRFFLLVCPPFKLLNLIIGSATLILFVLGFVIY